MKFQIKCKEIEILYKKVFAILFLKRFLFSIRRRKNKRKKNGLPVPFPSRYIFYIFIYVRNEPRMLWKEGKLLSFMIFLTVWFVAILLYPSNAHFTSSFQQYFRSHSYFETNNVEILLLCWPGLLWMTMEGLIIVDFLHSTSSLKNSTEFSENINQKIWWFLPYISTTLNIKSRGKNIFNFNKDLLLEKKLNLFPCNFFNFLRDEERSIFSGKVMVSAKRK